MSGQQGTRFGFRTYPKETDSESSLRPSDGNDAAAVGHGHCRRSRRDPWSSPNPARKKRNILPPPSGPGPPRAVAHQPGLVQRGSPAAPGASAGSVVPRGPCAPPQINRRGRAIAPASVFATVFGQPGVSRVLCKSYSLTHSLSILSLKPSTQ